MRILVIHNPTAGEGRVSGPQLQQVLKGLGFDVDYVNTKSDDWKEALQDPGALVLAAGGDGTVTKVARRLLGTETCLAILPLGTANNFAASLLGPGGWREHLAALPTASRVRIDAGMARGPWGERVFFEGCGFGIVPRAIRALQDSGPELSAILGTDAELRRDVAALRDALYDCQPRVAMLRTDDDEAEERELLLLSVLKQSSVGPRLGLAPDASPTDGMLHVVLAGPEDRERIDSHLADRLAGRETALDLEVLPVTRLAITWPEPLAHLDDKLWEGKGEVEASFIVRPKALTVLRPAG